MIVQVVAVQIVLLVRMHSLFSVRFQREGMLHKPLIPGHV